MCFPILSLDIIKAMIDSASLSFTEFLKKVDSGLAMEFMHVQVVHLLLILKSFFTCSMKGIARLDLARPSMDLRF